MSLTEDSAMRGTNSTFSWQLKCDSSVSFSSSCISNVVSNVATSFSSVEAPMLSNISSLNTSSLTSGCVLSNDNLSECNSNVNKVDKLNNNNEEENEKRLEELRKFVAPLSKEQLIELVSCAALLYEDVYVTCAEAVASSPSARRLMIRNIPFVTKDETFINLFKEIGEIEDATIVREKDGRSKGYGFVTFKYLETVQRCLNMSHTLEGKELYVKLAADPFTDCDQRKLFIRNLSDTTHSETLKNIFSQFGELEECVVVLDNTGKSKNYGFVTFVHHSSAFKAVQQSERIVDGRVAFIHFASPPNNKNRNNNNNNNNNTISSGIGGDNIRNGVGGVVSSICRKNSTTNMNHNNHQYNKDNINFNCCGGGIGVVAPKDSINNRRNVGGVSNKIINNSCSMHHNSHVTTTSSHHHKNNNNNNHYYQNSIISSSPHSQNNTTTSSGNMSNNNNHHHHTNNNTSLHYMRSSRTFPHNNHQQHIHHHPTQASHASHNISPPPPPYAYVPTSYPYSHGTIYPPIPQPFSPVPYPPNLHNNYYQNVGSCLHY